jgi:hypothetical protein
MTQLYGRDSLSPEVRNAVLIVVRRRRFAADRAGCEAFGRWRFGGRAWTMVSYERLSSLPGQTEAEEPCSARGSAKDKERRWTSRTG